MEHRVIKVAAAQLAAVPADKDANLKKIREYTKRAADQGVDFVVFPEMFYCGYDVNKQQALELEERPDGRLSQELGKLAKEFNIYIVCGYAELTEDEQSTYIATMVVGRNGELLHNHRKTYLFGDVEKINARPGTGYEVFETEYGTMGVLICYEMEFPEPARALAFKGAEVTFITSAFMNVNWMVRYLSAIAIQNQMYIVGVNHVGSGKGGCSRIVDQLGLPMAEGSVSGEELVVSTLDLDSDVRGKLPHFNEFRPETLQECYGSFQENEELLRSFFDPDTDLLA